MTITIDASVFLAAYLYRDDSLHESFSTLLADEDLAIDQPAIWLYEIVNGFRTAARRQLIDAAQLSVAWADLVGLPIELQAGLQLEEAPALLDLANASSLSAYDAAYLEHCVRTQSGLWTLDAQLRRAAQNAGIATF